MNRKLPLVTLGLCVRNNAQTIKLTIESILAQDYPKELIELLIVDGMSTDETIDIILYMLKNTEITWKLFNDEGKGFAFARQLVVENSSGDYVIWVDGDHVLPSDFVTNHVDFIEKDPELGAAEGIMEYMAKNIVSKLEGYTWYLYCIRRIGKDLNSASDGGAIYRVSALKAIGGYDPRIRGAGADGDVSHRIKNSGWRLTMNPGAKFKHVMRTSWISLWREYFWWGYGSHFTSHKHKGLVNPYRFLPPIAFFSGIRLCFRAYAMTKDTSCILMPFHYAWKRTAWTFGFLKAHLDGYGHEE